MFVNKIQNAFLKMCSNDVERDEKNILHEISQKVRWESWKPRQFLENQFIDCQYFVNSIYK